MKIRLNVWRQEPKAQDGALKSYDVDVSEDMSFLSMTKS